MAIIFSTRQVAELLGTKLWRIQRLYEDEDIPEPNRFAGKRVINGEMIPAIVDALRDRGWLPDAQKTTSSSHPSDECRVEVRGGDLSDAAIVALAGLPVAASEGEESNETHLRRIEAQSEIKVE